MQGLFGARGSGKAGQGCPDRQAFGEGRISGEWRGAHGSGEGRGASDECGVTEEEKSTILAMLQRRARGVPGRGRASAVAWAALKVAAVVMVVAGVGDCLGDGGEFDDGGVGVAKRPGGGAHSTGSAQGGDSDSG